MYSGQRGYEFDQIRTRIIVRKSVMNNYTEDEISGVFNKAPADCIPFILSIANRESLRTAVKIYNMAVKFAKALKEPLSVSILRNTKDNLIGAEI